MKNFLHQPLRLVAWIIFLHSSRTAGSRRRFAGGWEAVVQIAFTLTNKLWSRTAQMSVTAQPRLPVQIPRGCALSQNGPPISYSCPEVILHECTHLIVKKK